MATTESEVPTTEQPSPAAEEKKLEEEEKPVKEKKQKAPPKEKKQKVPPKEKKPKQAKTASHPPYFQMIKEAILALNEKSGSSPYAIAKYREEKHEAELPSNFRKILALQLKNSAVKGKLIKVKASYKLSGVAKERSPQEAPRTRAATKAKAEKKPAAEKKKKKMKKVPTAKPVEASKKKVGTKRTRRAAAAKPKQPKSIRSPGVRKTKRARVSAI